MTERLGGLWKQHFDAMIEQIQPNSEEEFEECIAQVNASRGELVKKGGYSSDMLVFGRPIRVPGVLTSDQVEEEIELHSRIQGGDLVLQRSQDIRAKARELCIQQESDKLIRAAIMARPRRIRTFNTGDVVYVWRRVRGLGKHRIPSETSQPRSGSLLYWSGPGIVIGTEGLSSVWVSVRVQVLIAPPEYVRLASEEEYLGSREVP
jgi:hypothetical protein